MKEVEVEFPLANIDVEQAAAHLAQKLALPVVPHGLSHSRDIFIDTQGYELLRRGYSFRLRQKLDNIYSGEGTRLTFKYPLEFMQDYLIREELKMNASVHEFGAVIQFISGIANAIVKQPAHITLAVEETSREYDLGESGKLLRIAYDAVKFKDPGDAKRTHTVNYLEIEDHGVGIDILAQAKASVEEYFALSPSTEGKYHYGLRALSLLPAD